MAEILPYVTTDDDRVVLNKDFFSGKHLVVCTPCYGGNVTDFFMISCLELQRLASNHGLAVTFYTVRNESLITRGRNSCTAKFLSTDATHMMFIDADIQFDAADVLRLIAHNVDVIAGSYPLKGISWDRLRQASLDGVEDLASASSYSVAHRDTSDTTDYGHVVPVTEAGTGFMLIQRNVFEVMKRSYPHLHYQHDGPEEDSLKDHYWNFWDTLLLDGRYLSEDYAFCHLWRSLGGKVFLDTSVRLGHTGTWTFRGGLS